MKKKLGIVFFLLSLAFLFTACGTTEINMNDYVDVSFSGYEYVGYPSSEVDVRKMILDNEDSFGFDRKALKKSPGEDVLADLEEAFIVFFDSYSELKNDDKVSFNWNVDEDILVEIEKEYKVSFLYEDDEVTVSGLEPLTDRNVFEYMETEFSGRDGDGYLSYFYFDDSYIKEQLIISKTDGLSNGDVITFSLPDTLITEYRWSGCNLVPASFEVTVSDLAVPETVDAFSGVHVYFDGWSPYISVYVETWGSDYDFDFSYDNSGYFANGDSITLTVTEDSMDDALEYYNIVPETMTKTYPITDRPTRILALDDVSETAWADWYARYETALADTISSGWSNPETLQSITAIGRAISVENNPYYVPASRVTTFYEVSVAPLDAEPFSYYYFVQHEGMWRDTDGSLEIDYDEHPYGYSYWGNAYGDCFIRDNLYYIGFETVEAMLDATINSDQNNGWTVEIIIDDSHAPAEPAVINVWSFTDEVPSMIQQYIDMHPELKYELNTTIIAAADGAYQPALDAALMAGGADAPDIYVAESAYVHKYTQGDAAFLAAAYEDLGIDMSKLESAKIAPYSFEVGTRPLDNKLVALSYEGSSGAFIYRRSIAMDVWGTDDPAVIQEKIGGSSGSWDNFFAAAEDLKEKGYVIVSDLGDLWRAVENSAETPWIVDGRLNIDPKREEFLDIAKRLTDGGYHNGHPEWQDDWMTDMNGESNVFGFFGPSWLINYTLVPSSGDDIYTSEYEGSYGDWAICLPPVGFFWGGTWILANAETEETEAVKNIIEWITLDDSETGLQSMWARGEVDIQYGTANSVTSGSVLESVDNEHSFLSGQDMYDVFAQANQLANGHNLSSQDETLTYLWKEQVRAYAEGSKSRDEALADFKTNVSAYLRIE